jgi:hypothetical protein
MRHILFSLLFTLTLVSATAPKNAKLIDWEMLSEIDFKDQYSDELEGWYVYPVFPEHIKALDDQLVSIKGYIIPVDVDGEEYALSAYPFSSCFFCGGAGPESVMTLNFKKSPRRYKTDEVIRFMGKLKLNDSDIDSFCYILNDAQPIEE